MADSLQAVEAFANKILDASTERIRAASPRISASPRTAAPRTASPRTNSPRKETNKQFTNFKVRNIVANSSMGRRIDLLALEKASASPKEIIFTPERFPGLKMTLYPYSNSNITAIIFYSGKFNITGLKTEAQLEEAHALLRRKLLKFIK